MAEVIGEDGVSGGLYLSRRGLRAALDKIRPGEAQNFVTYSIDRSARDVDHLRAIRKEVLQAGGRFFASGTEFDDTPEQGFMFNQFASMAEYDPIVTEEMFAKCQSRLQENQAKLGATRSDGTSWAG